MHYRLSFFSIALLTALGFIACGSEEGSNTSQQVSGTTQKANSQADNISQLIIRTKGSLAFGQAPIMDVYLNQVKITSRNINNTDYQDIAIDMPIVKKNDIISIAFTNDAYDGGSNQDRNLYIASITVNGTTLSSTDTNVKFSFGSGAEIFNNINPSNGREDLLWNGALHFNIPTDAPITKQWKKIANEGESFTVPNNTVVRYGSGSNWIEKTISGTATCTNQFFGEDPIYGVVKECYLLENAATPSQPNTPPLTEALPRTWQWHLPSNFLQPLVPAENPMSEAKADLGRFLFYDMRLSGNGTMSCATCHNQNKAFTDGKKVAIGSTGETHPRNTQSLGNVVYNPTLTWAHPQPETLEKQMEIPLFGEIPVEMGVNQNNREEILNRLKADPGYPARFAAAFDAEQGQSPITWPNIMKAIATFQRSMITGNSKEDRFRRNESTLTSSELHGRALFFGSASCFKCHGNFNFMQDSLSAFQPNPLIEFHNTGLFNINGTGAFPEKNRGIFEKTSIASDMGKFRPPSLRNVAVTAPYMHDGSMATLEEVVDFYNAGGRNITEGPYAGDGRQNPFKSPLIKPLNLSTQDKADLVAFLKTLTDEEFLVNPRFSDPFKR